MFAYITVCFSEIQIELGSLHFDLVSSTEKTFWEQGVAVEHERSTEIDTDLRGGHEKYCREHKTKVCAKHQII